VRRIVLSNFRIVDEAHDIFGSLIIENGIIKEIIADTTNTINGDIVINGDAFNQYVVVMPSFIDLHAHFREPGFPEKEVLESASLAAVAGGYTTAVCMANTNPVIDTAEKACALKARSDALGLIDLYPVLSLTKNMEGKELSQIKDLQSAGNVLMFSEDGKDLMDDSLFLAAMGEAKRLGVPISCHCDIGKAEDAEAENNAVRRAIELGREAGCHIHIAHVSTGEAAEIIRHAKKNMPVGNGFYLTCEATPHHIGATEADARRMGDKTYGRVNPPLRTEADRRAIVAAINDGTINAVATDHAPHTNADKAAGAPGFSGLETAFAVCQSSLPDIGLQRLSALLSANPARILGLRDRGGITAGLRADIVIVDTQARWKAEQEKFKSRGRCSPFTDREFQGKILMTFNAGKIVFDGDKNV
jgi:dihydroorotase